MLKRLWAAVFLLAFCAIYLMPIARADPPSVSNNYRLSESTLGMNGSIDSSSASYKSSNSAGDLGVGNSASTNYQTNGGSQTTDDPRLSVVVNSSSVSFGEFSASVPVMGTASFSITNYTTYGYIALMSGGPPANGDHVISPMATAGPSVPGFEQFGINLTANTSPTAPQNIGSNPVQTIFGIGTAAPSYQNNGQFKYVDGDTIALAPKDSGQTDYTISYLVNVGTLTPGGQYTTNQSLIVVGTY